jgi:glycosyltransferase involved in cell wall biosynthesis
MPHLHIFNRTLLALLVIWVSAAVVLVGYWTTGRGRQLEARTVRYAIQIATLLGFPDDAEQLRASQPELMDVAPAASAVGVPATSPRIRVLSPIPFDHPAEKGLVSVVIPTHNRAGIIGRAIESALEQSYGNIEVIVADDGSTDNTRAIATSHGPRVVYVSQPNAGVSAARNFGMRHARGEYIAFLDSDDAWRPWKIEAQIAALTAYPDAGLVWTDMAALDESDRVINPRYLRQMYSAYENVDLGATLGAVRTLGSIAVNLPEEAATAPVRAGDLSSAILLGNMIHTSTVLFRRSWCGLTGGFDESYARAGEDYELYIRLTSVGQVVFIDAPSTLYRIGAADQLTAPSMILEIARNNLRAVETWMPRSGSDVKLSSRQIRLRFAESFAWLGEAELDAGHSWNAARRLGKSIYVVPRLDRTALLLASCAVPAPLRDGLREARRNLFSRAEHSGGGAAG